MKFISSVMKEMHTVTWPTFNENIHNTTIVVFTGLAFALILVALTGYLNKELLGF